LAHVARATNDFDVLEFSNSKISTMQELSSQTDAGTLMQASETLQTPNPEHTKG